MNNKPRIDSVLFQLSATQQAQVFDWLNTIGYTRTLDRLAQPPPEGFGLQTHLPSLRRFYIRYSSTAKHEEMIDAAELQSDTPHVNLFPATEDNGHYAAFQLATSPVNINSFAALSRWILKNKALQQKERYLKIAEEHLALDAKRVDLEKARLDLEREKMELNAARLALRHLAKLQEIYGNKSLDDEDKVRAARAEMFGSTPANLQDPRTP